MCIRSALLGAQEVCLYAKQLAPARFPIADFLSKTPNAPLFLLSRNAVRALKACEALEAGEELSELGAHMLDLPLEPRYAKMLLYSLLLKCLDPVLTIVCVLALRDPCTPLSIFYTRYCLLRVLHSTSGALYSARPLLYST